MNKYYIEKEEALLLVIDIQERLLPVISRNEEILENVRILIQACGISEIPAVVTEQYPKGLGATVEGVKSELEEGTEIIEKISFSACNDDLKPVLEKYGRKKIIVAGIESHICVFQTVRDLIADGYDVYIAIDAMGSRSERNYENAVDIMREMGAVAMSTEMIVYNMLKKAGNNEFKKVSKLVK